MSEVCTIGLDIAKNKFQAHGEDCNGNRVFNKQIARKDLLSFFANIPPCLVGMEACGGSHYWAREISKLGHDVRLIPTRLVKPFVINNKTDAADAKAICEVVRRPNTQFVAIKTVDQQQLMSMHRIRERLVTNRTALSNQIRGLLLEEGIAIPQGIECIGSTLTSLIDPNDNHLSIVFKNIFESLYSEFLDINTRISEIEKKILQMAKTDENCVRLMKIPGVGYLTASAVVGHMGTARQFKNGRQFAACLGLTPREYSSGGKHKLLGISKRGDSYIRKLLVQGSRVIFNWWNKKESEDDYRKLWLKSVSLRRGKFKAIVAQANKTARIIWNVLSKNEEYIPNYSI